MMQCDHYVGRKDRKTFITNRMFDVFFDTKNEKFTYIKSTLSVVILLLCLTPVIGSVLQTRVHSTQYTADTVHTAAVAGREQ